MGGAPENDGVQQDRILPEIDPECRGTPTTGCLNSVERSAGFCKGGSTSGPDGLTGESAWENFTQTRKKPVAGGNQTTTGEPKLRV